MRATGIGEIRYGSTTDSQMGEPSMSDLSPNAIGLIAVAIFALLAAFWFVGHGERTRPYEVGNFVSGYLNPEVQPSTSNYPAGR